MYFKLALKNVRKSLKDYTIYFLTLTFGACIFYVFNSMGQQQAMLKMTESTREIFKTMVQLIGYVSVFIAIILGFLIIYANSFLIKRRKKEFGLYSLLGMPKSRVSQILSIETLMIGIVSLFVGLLLGTVISQGLSIIVARLFKANLSSFQFVFSKEAAIKTIVYFAIMFLLVMIFNIITVSKQKTIKLIYGEKKNQKMLIQKQWIYVIIFLVSLGCIGTGYYLVLKHGIVSSLSNLLVAIILGSVGTVLFFFSLSGFLLKVIQRMKGIYYRGLNMFTMRQLNSNINTAFMSISMICLMLFFTIVILSGGLGVSQAFNKNTEENTQFGVSVSMLAENREGNVIESEEPSVEELEQKVSGTYYPLSGYLKEEIPEFNDIISDYVDMKIYSSEKYKMNMFDTNETTLEKAVANQGMSYIPPVSFITQSDFNASMKLAGKKPITLAENEVMLTSNINLLQKLYKSYFKEKDYIEIEGKKYNVIGKEAVSVAIDNQPISFNMGTIIVPDALVENLDLETYYMNANFKDESKATEFSKKATASTLDSENTNKPLLNSISRPEIMEATVGLSAIFTFIAIYIGLVFLITSAAVLALKQLSDASDNIERYKLLDKIGVDRSMINKAIFTQIAIYFIMPLALAFVHSIVGLKVVTDLVQILGGMNILSNLLQIVILFFVVYGGYFIATYVGSKSMNDIKIKKN